MNKYFHLVQLPPPPLLPRLSLSLAPHVRSHTNSYHKVKKTAMQSDLLQHIWHLIEESINNIFFLLHFFSIQTFDVTGNSHFEQVNKF